MNKKSVLWSLASLLVLTSLLLSACGAPATTAAPAATEAPASRSSCQPRDGARSDRSSCRWSELRDGSCRAERLLRDRLRYAHIS